MSTIITGFWNKNKVFILGLLSAVAIVLQQFVGTKEPAEWSVIAFAVFTAVLSYFATQWRGQGASLTGIIGTLAATFLTVWQTGAFSWQQFFIQAVLAVIAASSPDPKSRGYEHAEPIVEAKREGEVIQPSKLTAKP